MKSENPNYRGKSLWKALLKYWAGLNILSLYTPSKKLRSDNQINSWIRCVAYEMLYRGEIFKNLSTGSVGLI
jgi:hypothetical protein